MARRSNRDVNAAVVRTLRAMRADAWVNENTGMGTARDSSYATSTTGMWMPLQYQQLNELYSTDSLAARIVDAYPNEAMRLGWTLPGYESAVDAMRTMGIDLQIRMLDMWARLLGGAVLVLDVDDGRDLSEPEGEGEVRWMGVFEPPLAWPQILQSEDWERIQVSDQFGHTSYVHRSRCVLMYGDIPPRIERMKLRGWGLPVLQRCWTALRRYRFVTNAADALVNEASVGTFKMAGLRDALAHGEEDLIRARALAADQTRSVHRCIMLDSDGESYERVNASFSGVNELLANAMAELAAAARMPVTILFGQSPGGLGSNGDAETRAWHEQLEAHRRNVLKPAILAVARRFGVPSDAEVEWPLLWQPTAAEQATVELQQSQADIAYVQAGIKTIEEVREARGLPPMETGYTDEQIQAMVVESGVEV